MPGLRVNILSGPSGGVVDIHPLNVRFDIEKETLPLHRAI